MAFQSHSGSQRVKVLYIIDQLCEDGGAERALLKTIRLLPSDRFEPHIVTFRLDPTLGIARAIPCTLHVLPLRRTYDAGALRTAVRLARLIRSQHIDIVHTFFETSDLWAAPIARISGVPVLISSRRDMGILRSRKHELAYRVLGSIFDQTQTVSEMVRQRFIRTDGLDPSRVVTVYNGVATARVDVVPTTERARVRRELNIAHASHVISTVGHIRRVKGFDVLVRAAAYVHNRFPDAVFIFAGENHDPDHYRDLLLLTDKLGLHRSVHFIGNVRDPIPLMKATDVFCLPSRSEGLSNALLEAMACGVPAVTTRVGGNPEVIEDCGNGYLVESEDTIALAGRISDLLENPDRRTTMGRLARRTVEERFSDEQMMARVIGEYEKLLCGRSGRATAA